MKKTDVKDRFSALDYTLQRLKSFEKKHKTKIHIQQLEDGYREYHVSIPVEFLDEAFDLQYELGEMGISFDTGCGFGYRDWELDYSFTYDKD